MEVMIGIGAVLLYFLIGYGWAMLYIHVLTDGYWVNEGIFTTTRTKMGVGTAVTFTVLWPIAIASVVLLIIFELIAAFFSKDFWSKMYRL